jgi:hypothetical protein
METIYSIYPMVMYSTEHTYLLLGSHDSETVAITIWHVY